MERKKLTGSTSGDASNFSSSVYMTSDADGDVEIGSDEEDLVESLSVLSLDPCGPCQQKGNKPAEAKWRCTDCRKDMCDKCNTMHQMFTQGHNTSKFILQPCVPCKRKCNKTTEGKWYCSECRQQMCEDCKEYHDMFTTGHTIMSGKRQPTEPADGEHIEKGGASIQRGAAKKTKTQPPSQTTESCPSKPGGLEARKKHHQPQGDGPNYKDPHLSEKEPRKAKRERSFHFISEIHASSPHDKKKKDISDVAFLPDGRLLMVDQANRKIKLFSSEFKLEKEKQFSVYTSRVAVFDNLEVAVRLEKSILRLSFEGDIVELGQIYLKFVPFAISYISRTKLVITETSGKSLYVIDINGSELQKVSIDIKNPWYVAVDRKLSRAYISNKGITAIDLSSGTVSFVYSCKWSAGVAVDENGDIFCLGASTHHQISTEGNQIGLFSTSEHFAGTLAWAISIHPNNRNAVIAGGDKAVFTDCHK